MIKFNLYAGRIKEISLGLLLALASISYCCKKEKTVNNYQKDFDLIFDKIKEKSIQKVDWTSIFKKTKDSISTFKSIHDKYRAIEYTLHQLGDEHSFFLYPEDERIFFKMDATKIPEVCHYLIDEKIAYLKIEGFGGNKNLNDIYASRIRKTLKVLDKQVNISGWVIDLRDNFGGKTGTFSIGLAPLYRDSILGFSMNSKKEFMQHILRNNTYQYGDIKLVNHLITSKDTLTNIDTPIAILVNQDTGSQAEFVTLILGRQENTRIFGTNTSGLTTDIEVFNFASGAMFGFSTANWYDPDKNRIKGAIIPDTDTGDDNPIEKAIKWIYTYEKNETP